MIVMIFRLSEDNDDNKNDGEDNSDNKNEDNNDLLISIQHSLPIPRGAPTLNHIGAQQLSLENWVLAMIIIHYPLSIIHW